MSAVGPLCCAFAGAFEFIYRSQTAQSTHRKKNPNDKKAIEPMRWKKKFQYFSLSVIFANHVRPGLTLITPLHATQHTAVYSSAIDSNSCRNGVRTVAACDMAAIATHKRSTHTHSSSTLAANGQRQKDGRNENAKWKREVCKKGLYVRTDVGVARHPICKLAIFCKQSPSDVM